MNLLEIRDLKVSFFTEDGVVRVLNGIDLVISKNEKLGLIGETGCGKTVLAHTIIRLLPENCKIDGEILYKGRELLKLSEDEMRRVRGKEIAMVFQNPLSSLNPLLSVGSQISEVLKPKNRAWEKAIGFLRKVGIPSPEKRAKEYPHEFSGGMRQRVMIAIALACNPSLIIADEPTKGLDMTIKAQIVELIKEVTRDKAMLLITHELGVAKELCQRVAVMYAGKIIEEGLLDEVFSNPLHPYTRGLLDSHPSRGLKPIKGMTPSLINLPEGCAFYPRCDLAMERCKKNMPNFVGDKNHRVRCFFADRS